jgi:hydroxyethylthiazole kinase
MINKWLLKERLKELRKKNPLIHHITNNVVANITANLTLAIGASPIMAGAIEEVEDIVKIADVLLLNMGTLTENQLDAMLKAALYAKKHNKKVIFDPVGVGASHFRRKAADRIFSEGLIDVVKDRKSGV